MNEEQRERFCVVQFFSDDRWEIVRQGVLVEEAMNAFNHYRGCVGAQVGTTVRVIVTDGGDNINMEWIRGRGITFPTAEQISAG